jgi:hypothetical protein
MSVGNSGIGISKRRSDMAVEILLQTEPIDIA